ncbi:P-loop containing nucleoside triphosphate hydrolase protein [Cristinia sonorae]|uniref:P-loop containing nucleoside triphosphate hydrolase protein n=1 Tax=Cristinia sonorae TaxID=1940300 RepID=A0A8K0XQR2_9AGAR|nr:P-loop containing nucleoside triphosphate hydrolase protein [Cristinia sonorae]
MARGRWGKKSSRKGVFDPNDADRIKHTRIGVWDVYEEKNPETQHIPIGARNWERYLEMRRDLPYVWTMLRDIGSIRDCWALLAVYTLLELIGSLIPAASLWFKGQLVHIVQAAVETRSVDKVLLTQVTAGAILAKMVALIVSTSRTRISESLGNRIRQYYSVHLFKANARLDVPTFEDEAIQRQLEDVSNINGQSVAWSTLQSMYALASILIQVVSQASVLLRVLKGQPDGVLLATISAAHSLSEFLHYQRTSPWNGVWAATTRNSDYIKLQGLKRVIVDVSHRKEFVSDNMLSYTLRLFRELTDRLGEDARDFKEVFSHRAFKQRLTLLSLMKLPFGDLPQVVFALRAVQHPASIPVSLASLNLITSTTASFSAKLYKIFRETSAIADAVSSVRKLYEIIEVPNKVPDGTIPFPEDEQKIKHGVSIEFRNVSFKYPGTDEYALRDVSFKLEAGQLCVIVGVNGSGKSTILKLIVRLYDPEEGQILLHGKDIRTLKLTDLREAISVLFQDYTHFPLSIRDNIALGDPTHANDDARVALAAKLGGSDEFIGRLPDGMDTYLDRPVRDHYSQLPEGTKTVFGRAVDYSFVRNAGGISSVSATGLSGGQMQRLAVSRTFMRSVVSEDSKVGLLLFDEPSASLDPAAEHDLFARLRELRGSKTMLFSSHRFGNLTRHADLILYMDRSKIVESGTHEGLLKHQGEYARIWMLQAQAFL